MKKITIEEYLGTVTFDEASGMLFAVEDDHMQMIGEVRGWGRIQQLFPTEKEAMTFQDGVGQFIADAINEKLQRERDNEQLEAYRAVVRNELFGRGMDRTLIDDYCTSDLIEALKVLAGMEVENGK